MARFVCSERPSLRGGAWHRWETHRRGGGKVPAGRRSERLWGNPTACVRTGPFCNPRTDQARPRLSSNSSSELFRPCAVATQVPPISELHPAGWLDRLRRHQTQWRAPLKGAVALCAATWRWRSGYQGLGSAWPNMACPVATNRQQEPFIPPPSFQTLFGSDLRALPGIHPKNTHRNIVGWTCRALWLRPRHGTGRRAR